MRPAARIATLALLAASALPAPAGDDATARSLALAKASVDAWDGTLQVLLAKEAVAAAPTQEAVTALYAALGEQSEVTALRHPGPVVSVAWSPDGAHLASACEDGSARVWSAAGAEEGATKFGRPAVRAWFLGGADRVLVATRGAAAETLDLALWSRDGAGAVTPLVAGAKSADVAVSPAGDGAAAIGPDGQATVWDRDGRAVKTLAAAAIVFHPQGGTVLVRTMDGRAQLVTMKGAMREAVFGRPVTHVAFAPSGTALVWGDDVRVAGFSADARKLFDVKHASAVEGTFGNAQGNRLLVAGRETYGLYDIPSGTSVRQWPKRAPFTCGAYCTSSAFLFTVDGGRHCSVWLEDDKLYREANLAEEVRDLSPSRDGTRFLVRGPDGTHRAFDAGLEPVTIEKSVGERPGVVAWHPSGEWLLGAGVKGNATLIHMYGRWPLFLHGHGGAVLDAAFSPKGDRAVTASKDGTVRIWAISPEGTETIGGFRGPCWYASCSWKEDRIVTAAWTNLRFTDGRGRTVASVQLPERITWCVATDDRTAVVTEGASSAQLYALDGRLVGELPLGAAVGGITSSFKGQRFAVWGTGGSEVRFFDAKAKAAGAIDAGDRVVGLALDTDGKRAAVSCGSGKVRIFPASSGAKAVSEFQLASCAVWVSFLPKGDLLLCVAKDAAEAQLLSVKGKPAAVFKGFAAPLTNYGISWAGDAVVVTSKDHTARVFDLVGRQTALLQHPDEVRQAQFLPDDQRILTTCKDGSARIWTRDGALAAEIKAHRETCWAAGFDAKCAQIVTAGEDGCARLWPGTVEGLLALAEKRAWRGFTDDERRQYAALLR